MAGLCTPEPVCDDSNVCTDDICTASCGPDGTCSATCESQPAEGKGCDDGDVCTVSSWCSGGGCTGGEPTDCYDGDHCTDDGCDPNTGCTFTPKDCGDGLCLQGQCVPVAPCDKVEDCDDGDPCTWDQCVAANCVNGPICMTGNECEVASCVDGECQIEFAPDGQACPGGPCSQATCQAGVCQGADQPCDDGDQCTEYWCDEATNTCVYKAIECNEGGCGISQCDPQTGCTYQDVPCDDGNACTWDSCENGKCIFGTGSGKCQDGDQCTEDFCDPDTGCVNTPKQCDDGNECTEDSCQEHCDESGCLVQCLYSPMWNTGCDDGDACTEGDTCQGEYCAGTPIECDYDEETCSGYSCIDGGCVKTSQGRLHRRHPVRPRLGLRRWGRMYV